MVENGETLDEGGEIEAVLTDLSFLRHLTALSIDQNLLIAKLKEKQYIYIHTYVANIDSNVLNNLQGALEKMFHWFLTNHWIANAVKYHL